MDITFKLEVFEGPLDLLLHLISKNKLDILTVEISSLLDQYLDYIAELQEQKTAAGLEIAAEFLEMAARLIYIKTLSLLPKSEEEETLRAELSGRLTELSDIKKLSLLLGARRRRVFVREPTKLERSMPYTHRHTVFDILAVFAAIDIKRKREAPPAAEEFSELTTVQFVSVESKIIYILKKLISGERVAFDEFFLIADNSHRVATFLALLELIKAKRVETDEKNTYMYMIREQQ